MKKSNGEDRQRMGEPVSFKEFFMREMLALREHLTGAITHEEDLRKLAEQSTKDALKLQGVEYERRLTDLNHAHALQISDKATFLSKETYELFKREFDAWKLEMAKAQAAESARQLASTKLWAVVTGMVASIFTAVLTAIVLGRLRVQ